MVTSEVSAAAKPLIALAGQLVGPARQLLAERAAGRSDLAVDPNLLTVRLRETVDRLADIDRNQPWWHEFLRSMGHRIVTPKYLRINAVQEWMRDVSVSTAITDVAKARITSAPRSQEVKPRAHLRSTYARYTGENAARADGAIEAIVGIVLVSFITSLRTQGGLVAVAGLVQEAHRRSYAQIENLSSRLERLEDLLLQLSGSSAQGQPTATRARRVVGQLVAVPSLPPYFVQRPRELAELKATLLATAPAPIAITGTPSRIGLQGMGGIGKSVMAAALAHDEDVREAFPDGVIWIRIGREHGGPADLRSAQLLLARAVGAHPPQIRDVSQGLGLLGPLLARKQCLVILDDVWSVDEIDAFDVLGPASRMLLTTRDASITRSIGGLEHELGLLDPASARDLLSRWAGLQVKDLPTTASAVAEECDRLPLALALCGALVRSGIPWDQVLDALRTADLAFVESRLPNYPYSNLLKALQVSVEALRDSNADWADRYLELAVLSLKNPVPETVIARLWLRTGGLTQRDCTKIVTVLHERALLRADGNAPFRNISIHDIQQDYLTAVCRHLDPIPVT